MKQEKNLMGHLTVGERAEPESGSDLEMTKRSTTAERRRTLAEQKEFALKSYRANEAGCWIWLGPRYRTSYGVFMAKRQHFLAHRAAYELANGPIPEGMVIDHLCRTPLCINPAHLEAVTNRENLLRGFGFGGRNARKTKCLQGHRLSGGNLYAYKGKRICRECQRNRLRQWRAS